MESNSSFFLRVELKIDYIVKVWRKLNFLKRSEFVHLSLLDLFLDWIRQDVEAPGSLEVTVLTCVCEFSFTHLVCIKSLDLSSNGIKIPADIVRQEAGYEDRMRWWVTEGEGSDWERGRDGRKKEKKRDDIEACGSSLIYAAREKSDAAGEDEETWKLTGWSSVALISALSHSHGRHTQTDREANTAAYINKASCFLLW